jgi:MFS family permease
MGTSATATDDRLRRNLWLLCAFKAGYMALFPLAVITLFWKHEIGLDMLDIMLLQGVFGLALAICEFPSGMIADRIGYRWSLLLAAVVCGIGWTLYLFAASFSAVLVAEIVIAVGIAFVSGTDSALLYESLSGLGREREFARWNGRVRFWGQAAEGTAALAAGALYALSVRLPFVLESGIWLVNIVIVLLLVEPDRDRPPRADKLGQIRQMIGTALWGSPMLASVILLSIVFGMSSFLPVWLVPLYAEEAGVPTAWLGPVWAGANYAVAIGALWSHRLERRLGSLGALFLCVLLIGGGYLGLGLSHALFGFLFYYLLTLMRGFNGPLLLHAQQRLIAPAQRAGMLSLTSLIFRLCFFVVGPLVGWGIDRYSTHVVFLTLAAVMPTLALMAWWLHARVAATQPPRSEDTPV